MKEAEIKEQVNGIVAEHFGYDRSDIKDDSSFEKDMGGDSLDVVEVVIECERHFKISIPDDKSSGIRTVVDLYNAVESLVL